MKPRQHVTRAGIKLIKNFEGLRTRSARLPGSRWVVGYGHTRSAREGVQVTAGDAEALLLYDLIPVEAALNEWIFAPLTQNQFDALVSFAFNIGLKNFRRSNVLRYLNEGAMLQAAGALEMWRRADVEGQSVVVDALVRRRAAEKALFLNPPEGWPHAPSAVLKPKFDSTAYAFIPPRAEEVEAPLEGDAALATLAPRNLPESEPQADLEPGPQEQDWTAAKAAAAAVSARLQELLPDDDAADHDGEIPQAPPALEEAAPDTVEEANQTLPDVDPFPVPEPQSVLVGASAVDTAELEPFPQAPASAPRLEVVQPANDVAAPAHADPQAQLPGEPANTGPYMLLALLGVVFWIMALVALFRTPPEGAVGDGAARVGWILGLAGAACVLGALWFLLGRDEIVEEAGAENETRP